MSKRKEGIKELRLIGAAMADMEVASELGQLKDKVSQAEQAVPSLMNQNQQKAVQQQAQMQRAERFEQLAQQAKAGEQKARNANNRT